MTEEEARDARDPRGEHACRHCAQLFTRASYHALHVAREHGEDTLTHDERARLADALAHEEAWLARVRKHARATLKVLPLVFFAFVVGVIGINADVNPAFLVLVLPPSLAAVAILYYLTYESA